MLIALAGTRDLPVAVIPGGVTLPPEDGEDAGKIQSVGVRLAHGEITIDEVNDYGCRACATAGGGCQFLGTAATSQVVAEALGPDPCRTPPSPLPGNRSGTTWRRAPPGR